MSVSHLSGRARQPHVPVSRSSVLVNSSPVNGEKWSSPDEHERGQTTLNRRLRTAGETRGYADVQTVVGAHPTATARSSRQPTNRNGRPLDHKCALRGASPGYCPSASGARVSWGSVTTSVTPKTVPRKCATPVSTNRGVSPSGLTPSTLRASSAAAPGATKRPLDDPTVVALKDNQIMDLLTRASKEIQAERKYARALEEENAKLKESLSERRTTAPLGPHAHCGSPAELPAPKGEGARHHLTYPTPDQVGAQMVTRLRRALAPQPSQQHVGEVVDAMVKALQRDVQHRLEGGTLHLPSSLPHPGGVPKEQQEETEGRTFRLERLRPCVYRLLLGSVAALQQYTEEPRTTSRCFSVHADCATPTFRKGIFVHGSGAHRRIRHPYGRVRQCVVHLSVDSGRLCVVRGGGHVNFIEYLERLLGITL